MRKIRTQITSLTRVIIDSDRRRHYCKEGKRTYLYGLGHMRADACDGKLKVKSHSTIPFHYSIPPFHSTDSRQLEKTKDAIW